MKAGNAKTLTVTLGVLMGLSVLLGGASALAQTTGTPAEACAADSLYLISPDELTMYSQFQGRPGLMISWPDISLDEATCYTITETDSLGFSVSVDGGFGDEVDRFITFTVPESNGGEVGHKVEAPLNIRWQSQGTSDYGVLAGTINLANNGGILLQNAVSGQFTQLNTGLPMTWKRVNVVALDSGSDGFMVAGMTGGETLDSEYKGLWVYRSGGWQRLAEDIFSSTVLVTSVAVSPTSNDVFMVGTSRSGLYVTTDGGQTFTNFRSDLDPTYENMPSVFRVTAMNFDTQRAVVFVDNFGLFISENNGQSFTRSPLLVEDNLDLETPAMVIPGEVYDIATDPSDGDRLLVGLSGNGTWESTDGGASWHDLYGDLNVPMDPGDAGYEVGAWQYSVLAVAVDPGDSQVLVALVRQEGLYRSGDGGVTWVKLAEDQLPENVNGLTRGFVYSVAGQNGHFLVQMDGHRLLESADSGQTWAPAVEQPFVSTGYSFCADGSGNMLLGTYGGGIYEPGSAIVLSETYNTTTSTFLRDLDLGLDITFGAGPAEEWDSFNLVAQTFQGWAVWRAPSYDRSQMTLLGLYDRVNPESCIEGFCGDESYDLVPQCYISKRAACFEFVGAPEGSAVPDTIRFFDDEVYNGFSYFYAVTTFDYGNTALLSSREQHQDHDFLAPIRPRLPVSLCWWRECGPDRDQHARGGPRVRRDHLRVSQPPAPGRRHSRVRG